MPSDKRVIAVRLDDATYETVTKMAAAQKRSTANMSELLIRAGLDVEGMRDQVDWIAKKPAPAPPTPAPIVPPVTRSKKKRKR
jgi:hypothetical protein